MLKSNFEGQTKIFRNDKGFYSTSISKKNSDDTWDNAYINVSFRKGVEIENGTTIDVKQGFLTFDKWENKEGKTNTFLKIFILDYEIVGNEKQPKSKKEPAPTDDDDLPF